MARVAPFAIFLALTFCQGKFSPASAYWFYLAKTLVAVWLIWEMRPLVLEMRWAMSWEAVVVGIAVFVMWVGLNPFYPQFKSGVFWDPCKQFAENSALAWLMIVTRILGSTLVVPPLEEVFYRSFLYRYLAKQNFLSVPLNQFLPLPFFATAAIFGFSHFQWLAGIFMRRGVSMAGASQKSSGRRDDGARDHEFSARRVGRVAGRVAVLVGTSRCDVARAAAGGTNCAAERGRGRRQRRRHYLFRFEIDVVLFKVVPSCCARWRGPRCNWRARGFPATRAAVRLFWYCNTSKVVALPTS